MKAALKYLLLPLLGFVACKQKSPDRPPDNKEIYSFFLNQVKRTAAASGYLKYNLVINKVRQTAPGQCVNQDHTYVTCFGITVDRTEYFDNYTGRYTTQVTNDTYRLYRNEYGELAIADHTPGQTNTDQKQRDHQENAF